MKLSHPFLALALTAIALSACSKVNDMHDATMSMSKTTDQMNANTAQMKGTVAETKELMGEIFDTGRQGAALDLRMKLWDSVEKAKKIEDKSTAAGLYMIAFEFQLWSKLGTDAHNAQRERLMKDSADEFFCHLLGITHWSDINPFAGKNPLMFGESENEKAAFNAVSIVLERINRKEELTASERDGFVSMRDMIETALLASVEIKAGRKSVRDYPAYVDIILSHEELAVRLLKARYQMLGLVVLTQLTNIGQSTLLGFQYKFLGKKWDLDFNKLNGSEMALAQFRLGEAMRARDILAKLGQPQTLDADIKNIYMHARVANRVSPKDVTANAAKAEALQSQGEFLGALNAYVGEQAAQ